jgi:hypothetical protein
LIFSSFDTKFVWLQLEAAAAARAKKRGVTTSVWAAARAKKRGVEAAARAKKRGVTGKVRAQFSVFHGEDFEGQTVNDDVVNCCSW